MKTRSRMLSSLLLLACIALPVAHSLVDINVMNMQIIREHIDSNVSACENFWQHTCGNWDNSYVDYVEHMEDLHSRYLHQALSDNHTVEKAPRLMQQMSDYLNACLTNTNEEPQLPKDLLKGQFEWTRATAKLRKYGLNGVFFDESVDVAYNDSLQYVVQLKMSETQNNNLPSAVFGMELERFEAELRALKSKHLTEEPLLQSWTLAELKQQIPQVDWQIYFNELLDMDVNSAELRVEVSDVEYLRDLGTLLQRSSESQLELYLRLQLANLAKKSNPTAKPTQRLRHCVRHMRALLPLGVNYIYDRYVYRTREQDTQQLNELFANLRGMFGKYLRANRLQLTNEQLDYVRAKLMKMRLKVGNLPESTLPDDFYDKHYASASFRPTDFHHNLWEAYLLRTRLQYAPLKESGHRLNLKTYYVNDDLLYPRNAPYFEHARNTLTVPLLYHFPLYDHRLHAIFRGSLMGFILGHELNHAFEEEGILFDADGNQSPMGLKIRQLTKFQAAIRCVQQTPTISLKERLADVNGLQLAYDAYFGWPHDSRHFEYQPFFFEQEYLAPQLFHLSFAQFFCGRLPQAIGHDMDDVRVKEAVKNLHQFDIDFNCGEKTKTPVCEMWRPAEGIEGQ